MHAYLNFKRDKQTSIPTPSISFSRDKANLDPIVDWQKTVNTPVDTVKIKLTWFQCSDHFNWYRNLSITPQPSYCMLHASQSLIHTVISYIDPSIHLCISFLCLSTSAISMVSIDIYSYICSHFHPLLNLSPVHHDIKTFTSFVLHRDAAIGEDRDNSLDTSLALRPSFNVTLSSATIRGL